MVELIWEARGVVRRLAGVVTATELDESAAHLQGHRRLDEFDYNIHDFSAATDIQIDDEEIEFLAVRAAVSLQRNPRIRLAFVGVHPVVQRFVRAFNDSGCSAHRCHHFDTLAAARRFVETGIL